jgi:pimeloyl-ACP methyl ester carboxylesterase
MTGTNPDRGCRDRILSLGTRIVSYTVWGDPGGEPVMMVHGLNTERHLWAPIARQLSSRYFVVCPDLRGHGDSSWTPEGYHLAGFVADLRILAEHLGIFPFHYVGHSLGARVGIAYAGELSPTLRTLTLSDSGPEVSRTGALAVRDRQAKIAAKRAFRDEAEALEFIRSLQPSWQPAFHDLYVKHQLRLNWAGRLVQKADPDLIWITGAVSLKDVPYLWDMMARIEVPTLIMWGRTSELMDAELVDRMLAATPRSQARVFDTGHYIPREQPEQFTAALAEFLGVPEGKGARR